MENAPNGGRHLVRIYNNESINSLNLINVTINVLTHLVSFVRHGYDVKRE